MFHGVAQVWGNERGASGIEYCLIAAMIGIAAVAVLQTVGASLSATFATIASNM